MNYERVYARPAPFIVHQVSFVLSGGHRIAHKRTFEQSGESVSILNSEF
jgi:hypothetical protein